MGNNMKVQTDVKNIDQVEKVYVVIDNENWIQVEFVDGEFKIKTYRYTTVVVEPMTIG
jgi:hypothetical protein